VVFECGVVGDVQNFLGFIKIVGGSTKQTPRIVELWLVTPSPYDVIKRVSWGSWRCNLASSEPLPVR